MRIGAVYGMEYYRDMAAVLDRAIAQIKRKFYIQHDKVFVSGISASGASSWYHGIFSSDLYAAIHPVSIIPTDFAKDMYLNLMNTGIYVWQGDADQTTPLSKVSPMIDKIKKYGLKVFYYVQKGGGHGGSKYIAAMPTIMPILLKTYTRSLSPAKVHRGILSPRGTQAYWLKATRFSASFPKNIRHTAVPPAVIQASWVGKQVTVLSHKGVKELELRWRKAQTTGAGQGKVGDTVKVIVDGKATEHQLQEDFRIAMQDYCYYGDTSRLWAGAIRVSLPAK